jgi:pullulanase/glycogen debranching enzyme
LLICWITSVHEPTQLIVVMNAFAREMEFFLPGRNVNWRRVVDTASPTGFPDGVVNAAGATTPIAARAFALFIAEPESPA